MPRKPLERKDIIDLLSKLKEETPEYPTELVKARKESFLKQALEINVSGGGHSGEGGHDGGEDGPKGGSDSSGSSGSGSPDRLGQPDQTGGTNKTGGSSGSSGLGGSSGSGAASSGGIATSGLGISLKSALTFGAIVVLLTATYLFREQIVDYLAENNIVSMEETAVPSMEITSDVKPTDMPRANTSFSIEESATESVPGFEDNNNGSNDNNRGNDRAPGSGESSDNSSAPRGTPESDTDQVTATPTTPDQGGLVSVFRHLICVLRFGAESCK